MEKLQLPENPTKKNVFLETQAYLGRLSLGIAEIENQKPWGGYFTINNDSTEQFIENFYPELDTKSLYKYGRELRPKILLVQPKQILSWQYHHRRAEIWKPIIGPVGFVTSNDDIMPETHQVLRTGEKVEHGNQVRHRLIGLENWGVVAEIWQHTVKGNLSDEADIVRLEDQYGRG